MGMETQLEMNIIARKNDESNRLKMFIEEFNSIEFNYDKIDEYITNQKQVLGKYDEYSEFIKDHRATILLNNLNFTETDDYIIFETLGECSIKNYTETYEKFFKNCIEPLTITNGYFKTLYEEDDEYKIFLEKDKNEN